MIIWTVEMVEPRKRREKAEIAKQIGNSESSKIKSEIGKAES